MSEKVKIKIARNVVHLPAIALRGLVVFPNNVVHFEVGRTKSIAAIEAAMRELGCDHVSPEVTPYIHGNMN